MFDKDWRNATRFRELLKHIHAYLKNEIVVLSYTGGKLCCFRRSDYYGARQSGYVIRNGVLYRDSASDGEMLLIRADGSFEIVSASAASAEELLSDGAWQVLCFGPGLVEDGVIAVEKGEEVGHAKASNPRTAIGMLGEGHYLFLVSDGRTGESEGLSLSELAELMAAMGCREAYNLDGGGSSTMVFLGEVVNNPTTNGKRVSERSVSDIVYVG